MDKKEKIEEYKPEEYGFTRRFLDGKWVRYVKPAQTAGESDVGQDLYLPGTWEVWDGKKWFKEK